MKEIDAAHTPMSSEEYRQDWDTMPGVIAILGELETGAVITEEGLGCLFNRHSTSIKRAVRRGELPEPCRLFGQSTWTVGSIIRHIESRLIQAAEEAKSRTRKIAQLSP